MKFKDFLNQIPNYSILKTTLNFERKLSPEVSFSSKLRKKFFFSAFKNIEHAKLSMVAHQTHRGNISFFIIPNFKEPPFLPPLLIRDAQLPQKIFSSIHDNQETYLNPVQDGLFWGCSRMGGTKRPPLPKICHAYPTMMKLRIVVPYLKKIQKLY